MLPATSANESSINKGDNSATQTIPLPSQSQTQQQQQNQQVNAFPAQLPHYLHGHEAVVSNKQTNPNITISNAILFLRHNFTACLFYYTYKIKQKSRLS